jgi:hypothetical protein
VKTTRHKLSRCPHCDYRLDASSSVNGEESPRPSDFTMCWGCAAILRYRRDLSVGVCAPWELEELEPESRRTLLTMRARRRADIEQAARQ